MTSSLKATWDAGLGLLPLLLGREPRRGDALELRGVPLGELGEAFA